LACCVEFDRQVGWTRHQAEAWVSRCLRRRDLGRTVLLEVPHRMQPALAAFLSDWLFAGAYQIRMGDKGSREPPDPCGTDLKSVLQRGAGAHAVSDGPGLAVEFMPVPPLPREPKNPPKTLRPQSQNAIPVVPPPGRRPLSRKGGAGLEVNTAEPRQRERLPAALRPDLANCGLANLAEAQAIVSVLEKLAADPKSPIHASGTETDRPRIGVIALYPAQAELIQRLMGQSAHLSALAGQVKVGTPAAFAERECQIALVSLTRSHTHRAVSFGEGPRMLILALTRARSKLVLFGDPGTLARRRQWEGPLDHLGLAEAFRERDLVAHLVAYLEGQGPHAQTFHCHEGIRE
jgi:hypothetical protein